MTLEERLKRLEAAAKHARDKGDNARAKELRGLILKLLLMKNQGRENE